MLVGLNSYSHEFPKKKGLKLLWKKKKEILCVEQNCVLDDNGKSVVRNSIDKNCFSEYLFRA